MLTNWARHATDRERQIRVGDFCRFPLASLGDEDVYAHRWEVTSFTADGCVVVRRLHDGTEKTLAARWILMYSIEPASHRRTVAPRPSMREYRKAHPNTARREAGREYFVSCQNDAGEHAILMGPYDTHDDAEFRVLDAKRHAAKVDRRAFWYAYGTCSAPVGTIQKTHFGKGE